MKAMGPGKRRLIITVVGPFAIVVAAMLVVALVLRPFGDGLVFQTRQTSYYLGDPVEFYLTNGRSDPVSLSNPAPWNIEREVAGVWTLVYFPYAPGILWELRPGETLNWVWVAANQTNATTRIPVEEGNYRISLVVQLNVQYLEKLAYFSLRSRLGG